MGPEIAGFIGDLFALGGSLLLAVDAVKHEREFDRIPEIARKLPEPKFAKIRFKQEGVELCDENEVHRVFIRRSARKAKYGYFLLVVGFALLVISRIMEIQSAAH